MKRTPSSYLPRLTEQERQLVAGARKAPCRPAQHCSACDTARLLVKLVDRAVRLDATRRRTS